MTLATRALALDRVLLSLPGGVLGRALSNARRSLEEIGDAVSERALLGDLLTSPADSPDTLTPLTRAACLDVLAAHSVGRLAYVARDGTPDIVPVNYVLHDGQVLVRSGAGPKLQAAERRDDVAFEVDDIDESARTALTVVVVGRAERLRDAELLGLPDSSPWAAGPRLHGLRIVPRRITGRRLL